MCSTHSIKLELLLDSRIRVERVNLFELKSSSSITLIKLSRNRIELNRLKKLAYYYNKFSLVEKLLF